MFILIKTIYETLKKATDSIYLSYFISFTKKFGLKCSVLYKLCNFAKIFAYYKMGSGLPWRLRWQRICLQCRTPRFNPGVGKIPWRRKWLPTAIFLPGEFNSQRNLVGYSPWCHRVGQNWATFTFMIRNNRKSLAFKKSAISPIVK